MSVKFWDTVEGWYARGYALTPDNTPIGVNSRGQDLYSWGQVRPLRPSDETPPKGDTTPQSGTIERKGATPHGTVMDREHERIV
jgi:hypothetical protein